MTRKETIPRPPGVTGLGLPTTHPGWDFHWSCGRRFNPSCPGPAPVPTGSQVVSCQHPLLWGRRMKGEVGAESQEEGAQDKKPSRRLRQRQAELSAEGVITHKHTDLSPRDNACRARLPGKSGSDSCGVTAPFSWVLVRRTARVFPPGPERWPGQGTFSLRPAVPPLC